MSVDVPGGGVPTLGCIPICRRSSSGEGIPGVGVTPGFIGFLSSAGLGIPGVGVAPFGTVIGLAGIPGVGVPVIGTGLVESPGGRLLLSRVTERFELLLALFEGVEPQAVNKTEAVINNERRATILYIISASPIINKVMPVQKLRPRRAATTSKPAPEVNKLNRDRTWQKQPLNCDYKNRHAVVNTVLTQTFVDFNR